jgi:hypothetical protein
MSKLYFYTPTTLDEAFIFTMGASVKKTDSPIGFFGTGLKYAIAVTLRLGGSIKIQSDKYDYSFHYKTEQLRGEDFRMIYAVTADNKWERCPMTTDYGKTWEPWMVMRELWSNTQDEKGITWDRESLVETDLHEEWTLITVDHPEIYDAWVMRDKYLLNLTRRPLYETDLVQVFQGRSNTLFYRGIAVSRSSIDAQFTYNLKSIHNGYLSEDRTVDAATVRGTIAYALYQCNDPIMLSRYFDAACTINSFESGVNFNYWSLSEATEQYKDAAIDAVRRHVIYAPAALKEVVWEYKKNHDTETFYKPCKISEEENARYTACITKLRAVGFDFSLYSIYFTQDMPPIQAAAAITKKNIIILNYNTTINHENWQRQTMMSLIEEYVHLDRQVRDETREMQEAYNDIIYQLAWSGSIK